MLVERARELRGAAFIAKQPTEASAAYVMGLGMKPVVVVGEIYFRTHHFVTEV